jgi:hypothetical protein
VHLSQIQRWVPVLGLLLDVVAAALVVKKRLWRQLPAFSWYLLFGVVCGISYWIVTLKFRSLYFYFYFSTDAIYKVLNIWVTFEIYSRLMNSFPALRQLAWKVLWIAGVILLATCALIYQLSTFQGVPPLFAALYTIGRTFRVVQLGLLFVIFLIARSLQIRLRRYYAFIAIGLVMIDSGEFISLSILLANKSSLFAIGDSIPMLLSIAVTTLWIVVLFIGEGAIASNASPNYAALPLAEIREWNDALSETRGL